MRGVFIRTAAVSLTLSLFAVLAPSSALAATTPPSSLTPTTTPSPTALGDGGFNMLVSPTSDDLVVSPGSSVTTTLSLQNQGLQTEHIKVLAYSFGAKGEDGTPQLIKPGPTDTFINWISFSSTQFDTQPGVWTSIKVTISPPKTAAFGYYYAVIFQRDNPTTGQKQTNLQGAVASLLLVDVQAPGASKAAKLVSYSTDHKTTEFLPVNFTVRMFNTGNVHVAPHGNIYIYKGSRLVGTLYVNNTLGEILPQTYRAFTATWSDGTPAYKTKNDAKGKPVTSLDWSNFNLSKLRFGDYTARLVVVYNNGENDVPIGGVLHFWVIPWRILAGLILLLVLLLGGLLALIIWPLRRRSKRGYKTSKPKRRFRR